MTVQNKNSKDVYRGNGVTTVFPFTFDCPKAAYLHVYVGDGTTESEETDNFVLDLANKRITYPAEGEPLPSSKLLTISRKLPLQQLMDLVEHGPFLAEDLEKAYDELTMMIQQCAEALDRTLKLDLSMELSNLFVPWVAGKSFRINDAGTGLETTEDPAKVLPLANQALEATKQARDDLLLRPGYLAVEGDLDNIDAVAENEANVNIVAADIGNVNIVGSNITKVNAVGDNIGKVTNVSDNINDVKAVADIKNDVSDVAGIKSDVVEVAGKSAAVSKVAADIESVTAVAADLDNIDAAPEYAALAKQYAVGLPTEPPEESARTWALRGKVYTTEGAHFYDSVEEMKLDDELEVGQTCVTTGYYTANDGGMACYKVRAKATGDTDDGGYRHFLQNNLVAEMVIENNTINVKQFGVKSDGVTDVTTKLQYICNSVFDGGQGAEEGTIAKYAVYLPKGTYLVSDTLFDSGTTGVKIGLHIFGDGAYRTFIKRVGDNVIFAFQHAKWSHIHDMTIDVEPLSEKIGTAIQISSSSTPTYSIKNKFENLWIKGFNIGIDEQTGWDNIFRRIYLINCNTGISIRGTGSLLEDVTAEGCYLGMDFKGGVDIVCNKILSEGNEIGVKVNRGNFLFNGLYLEGNDTAHLLAGEEAEIECLNITNLHLGSDDVLMFDKIRTLILDYRDGQAFESFQSDNTTITPNVKNCIINGMKGYEVDADRHLYNLFPSLPNKTVEKPLFYALFNKINKDTNNRYQLSPNHTELYYALNASGGTVELVTENRETFTRFTNTHGFELVMGTLFKFNIQKKYVIQMTLNHLNENLARWYYIYFRYKDSNGNFQTKDIFSESIFLYNSKGKKTVVTFCVDFPKLIAELDDFVSYADLRIRISSSGYSYVDYTIDAYDVTVYEGTPANNSIIVDRESQNGFHDIVLNKSVRVFAYSSPPDSYGGEVGDIVFNSAPSAGGSIGWVCVAKDPDTGECTWKTFGAISN